METNLSENLRCICAEVGSVSQICRDIGINRQQFNRYLNEGKPPSAHNMRRIARYFDVPEADFLEAPPEFMRRHVKSRRDHQTKPIDFLDETFRDQARLLRRYAGFYHVHFKTPSWTGMVLRSLIHVYEKDGYMMTRLRERARSRDDTVRQRSAHLGALAMRGNRIYLVEKELLRDGSIAETILEATDRQQLRYLQGMSVSIAWRPRATPYASRVVWKRVPERTSARDALRACGAFPIQSTQIDPTVRRFLQKTEADGEPGFLV